jgi:hypothetical protein
MHEISIEQAIYGNPDAGGYRFLARSPGFLDDWLPEAQRLCTGFGERPAGLACPAALFAQPFGRHFVAIVQIADQGTDDAGRPGALAFHLLIIPRFAYRAFGGDPFQLAERCPPPWQARRELPALTWPAEPLSPRTVAQVQRVLQRAHGPNLLGASQVLVDGGQVVFARRAPDAEVLRDLWTLLPTSTRCELWPASFIFGNALGFHAAATPNAASEEFSHYQTEESAGEYPEGRYELALQTAAEAGDQRALDRLFARRTPAETMRLGLYLLAVALIVSLAMALINPAAPTSSPKRGPSGTGPASSEAPPRLDLPPADQFRTLSRPERDRLTHELGTLAKRAGVSLREAYLRQAVLVAAPSICLTRPPLLGNEMAYWFLGTERLLAALDQRLGTPDPARDPGPLHDLGPPERQLRALLWKHGIAAYNDPRLNPFELVERLEPIVGR